MRRNTGALRWEGPGRKSSPCRGELGQTGGIRDAARLVPAYLGDPAPLSGKIYLR